MKGKPGTLGASSKNQAIAYIARKVDVEPGTYKVGDLLEKMGKTLRTNVTNWISQNIIAATDEVTVKAKKPKEQVSAQADESKAQGEIQPEQTIIEPAGA